MKSINVNTKRLQTQANTCLLFKIVVNIMQRCFAYVTLIQIEMRIQFKHKKKTVALALTSRSSRLFEYIRLQRQHACRFLCCFFATFFSLSFSFVILNSVEIDTLC